MSNAEILSQNLVYYSAVFGTKYPSIGIIIKVPKEHH